MHKGQPYALRILCLRVQCTIVLPLLRITLNKISSELRQILDFVPTDYSQNEIELFDDLKLTWIYHIQVLSSKASLRDIPMCIACGKRAKLWIEIFFSLQIQKVIAYTNEKLIF